MNVPMVYAELNTEERQFMKLCEENGNTLTERYAAMALKKGVYFNYKVMVQMVK